MFDINYSLDKFTKKDRVGQISKINIVEGFDCTGKSYLIDKINNNNFCLVWEPKYDSDINNKVIPYNDRYALGVTLVELAEANLLKTDYPYVINRGLLSGMIYNKLYNQGITNMDNPEFIEYAKSKYSNPNLIHTIYITHVNKDHAKQLYEYSLNRSGNESYDKFASFDEYFEVYKKFDEEYVKLLEKICGTNYTIVSSLSLDIIY